MMRLILLTLFFELIYSSFNGIDICQDGTWIKQSYNNSFLFDFLDTEKGFALIQYQQSSKHFLLTLSKNKNDKKQIKIASRTNHPFIEEISFYLNSTSLQIKFVQQNNLLSQGQQQEWLQMNHLFNITHVSTKSLKIASIQGNFLVKLFNRSMLPQIYVKKLLACAFIVSIFFGTKAFQYFYRMYVVSHQTRGYYSIQIIWIQIIFQTFQFINQISYLQYNGLLILFEFFLFVTILLEIVVLIWFLGALSSCYSNQEITAKIICYISWIILLSQLIISTQLWYLLLLANMHQLYLLLATKPKQTNQSAINKLAFLSIYSLPIAIFPYYSFEVGYSQSESKNWWKYLVLCLFQLACFEIRTKRGLKHSWKKISYMLKRLCKLKNYQSVQQDECPICFQAAQGNLAEMSLSGRLEISDWVQAPCNHYVHKQCLKDNNGVINSCYFDNTKWGTQIFKKLKK